MAECPATDPVLRHVKLTRVLQIAALIAAVAARRVEACADQIDIIVFRSEALRLPQSGAGAIEIAARAGGIDQPHQRGHVLAI